MKTPKNLYLFTCILALALLASACSPAAPVVVNTSAPENTTAPVNTTAPEATSAPSGLSFAYEGIHFTMDPALGSGAVGQLMPEVANADGAYWARLPVYKNITLKDYPVAGSDHKPEINVYPLDEYRRVSPQSGELISALAIYLDEKPADALKIPALPLRNAVQSLHSNVQFLDFQNGRGVRFLTMYSQGPVPVNNASLFYTFQGFTADGRYLVVVNMPVTFPELHATSVGLSQAEYDRVINDKAYYTNMAAHLSEQVSGSFTPDLAALDAMIQSLKID